VRRDLSLEVLETCWARLAVCPRVMDALLTLWKNGHPRAPAALRSVAEEAALAETVDALAPLLSGPTRRRELVLAGVFAELGVGAREYLPARELARLLRDPDPEVRGQAVRIARMQDRQGEPGTTELLRELLDSLDEDADLPVMLAAAELGRRTAGPAWESTLTQWMESADPQRRVRAARVVEALCWRPPRGFVCALPLRLARRFAMLVRDGAPEVRAVAVGVLLRLGTRGMGRGSAALLSDQLDATDAGTVKAALNGLTHTPPPERTSELTARVNALLAHADAEVREETIGLLRAWGPDTTPDLGRRLLAACTDPDEEVADAAAYALAALPGGGGTEVQDGLLLLALDPRSEVRAAAASALRGSSELPPGPEQLACLCRLLDDPVDTVRNLAAWAVEGFQRQGIRLQRIP
jgi:HEAT repeat protein